MALWKAIPQIGTLNLQSQKNRSKLWLLATMKTHKPQPWKRSSSQLCTTVLIINMCLCRKPRTRSVKRNMYHREGKEMESQPYQQEQTLI